MTYSLCASQHSDFRHIPDEYSITILVYTQRVPPLRGVPLLFFKGRRRQNVRTIHVWSLISPDCTNVTKVWALQPRACIGFK